MTQIDIEKIKQTTRDFFNKTGLPIEIEVKALEDSTVAIDLKTEEPQILIGERGQTLSEIQHLLKLVIKRIISPETSFYINLDINDYKKKKTEYLKEIAKAAADEVSLTKKEKALPAMPPFERRIIHLELASRSDVITESIGQEPERRVVIRAYP